LSICGEAAAELYKTLSISVLEKSSPMKSNGQDR